MAAFRQGEIVSFLERTDVLVRALVQTPDGEVEAVGYPHMLGPLREGSRVVINTTGIALGLGTGGVAFILCALDEPVPPDDLAGHIVKLRYTPWQTNVMAAEAPEGPHHRVLSEVTSLNATPVVSCGLHSQVPAAAAGIKAARPDAKVGYLMTDGGALPLAFSRSVRQMTEAALVDVTCTSGHAFGGDLEAVTVFSALLALSEAAGCDAIVVAPGPGVVGTATPFGHSGMEQGQVSDAAASLGGHPIAALRISFDDQRERHRGISHHSLAALGTAARERAVVAVPKLVPARAREVARQLEGSPICARHQVVVADGRPGLRLLQEKGLDPTSMGRSMTAAPELWLAAAAAGALAGEALEDHG